MTSLRDVWEATSFRLELLQANNECVKEEQEGLKKRKAPKWVLTFDPEEVCLRTKGMIALCVSSLQIVSESSHCSISLDNRSQDVQLTPPSCCRS